MAFRSTFRNLNEVPGGFLEQVPFNFAFFHLVPLCRVLLLHELDQALELNLAVVAATAGGHVGHRLHLLQVCVVLIKHLPHSHADARRGLALHHELVEVLG